jgi:hypothetical protein
MALMVGWQNVFVGQLDEKVLQSCLCSEDPKIDYIERNTHKCRYFHFCNNDGTFHIAP